MVGDHPGIPQCCRFPLFFFGIALDVEWTVSTIVQATPSFTCQTVSEWDCIYICTYGQFEFLFSVFSFAVVCGGFDDGRSLGVWSVFVFNWQGISKPEIITLNHGLLIE